MFHCIYFAPQIYHERGPFENKLHSFIHAFIPTPPSLPLPAFPPMSPSFPFSPFSPSSLTHPFSYHSFRLNTFHRPPSLSSILFLPTSLPPSLILPPSPLSLSLFLPPAHPIQNVMFLSP